METIIVITITIIIMTPIALTINKKIEKAEKQYKEQIIKYKENKDLNKENNFYLENIAKDINNTKNTLKLFLFIYILPTILLIIISIEIITKIENLL